MRATRSRGSETRSAGPASASSRLLHWSAPDAHSSSELLIRPACYRSNIMRPIPGITSRVRRASGAIGRCGLVAILVASCSSISRTPPAPTPADFQGIAGAIVQRGIRIEHIVSGDPGCPDQQLGKTAIGFDAAGLDQATPVRLYLYIFRSRETYERLRATVDECARSYVTDPETYESVETSPYVLAGQGPWGAAFKTNLRAAIDEAAGTGD
jgi:hypothetical protein